MKAVALAAAMLGLAVVGLAQSTDTGKSKDSTSTEVKKKRSGVGRFLKETVLDGAKDGATEAVKDHPLEVKVCEDDRSLNDLAEEAGRKSVQSSAQRKATGGIQPAPCKTAPTASAAAKTTKGPKIGDTELKGLFTKFPRREDPRTQGDIGWPRVALTLLQAPTWHASKPDAFYRNLPSEGDACWEFKAKIWDSPTQSRDVQPFWQCDYLEVQGGDMKRVLMFSRWAGFNGPQRAPTGESTGLYRNEGPIPPDSPFPNSVPYQKASFGSSYSGIALRMMIDATAIDYSQRDRRLWVIVAPQLEPEGSAVFNQSVTPPPTQSVTAQPKVESSASVPTKGLNRDGSCGGVPASSVKTMTRWDSTYECVNGQMLNAAGRKSLEALKTGQK